MADEGASLPAVEGTKGRPRNLYAHVRKAWKDPGESWLKDVRQERLVAWRRGGSFGRGGPPPGVDRARGAGGGGATRGFVGGRARARRGGLRKVPPMGGRHPKRRGVLKITMAKSIQRIAEERGAKRYPNMEGLASYWIGEDGMHKFYEGIPVDPNHPAIRADAQARGVGG